MGTLFIVATPIGNLGDMTARAIETLRSVSLIAAEDTRHTGNLLHHFEIRTPTISYHHHNRSARAERLLAELAVGDVALVSDAGTPAVADPGHELVVAALAAGHLVVPIPGASSLLAAVSASGIVDGPFLFVGFLPRSGEERVIAISRAASTGVPFVIFESPLRTKETLADLAALDPDRPAVVARELTKMHEEFLRGTLEELQLATTLTPARGEVVIVVGASVETTGTAPDDHEALARSILQQGLKPSRAARELAATTGLTASDAYELIQRVRASIG